MSEIYQYEEITNSPNLKTSDAEGVLISGIHYDVANSAMVDKAIVQCTWDEATAILIVEFENTLIAGDKTILDAIVSNNS